MPRLPLAASLVLLAAPALAQDETALRRAFEGRYVTVKLDMPASHKGVDLRMDRESPFDVGEHSSRLREYDASIHEGQRVQVTRVKVKDDLVEFHLAGGGFNWASDTTTQSFSSAPKTGRESDLERRIKNETDHDRKRDMQRELDDLRRERARRDERRRREVEDYNERARERDRDRAVRSGSRFNVRFKKQVPLEALTPEGLEDYLARWVDFSGKTLEAPVADERAGEAHGWLRKGASRAELEARLGPPVRETPCPGGAAMGCVVAVYQDRDEEIEATFVEDVLVRFSSRSR